MKKRAHACAAAFALLVFSVSACGADDASARSEFVLALERIRQRQPEPPDSPALVAYVIHDYLIAARLRRDLATNPGDALDTSIDSFLTAHAGLPVARALRHDWLVSLGDRRRWDWLLPRSADSTDPVLICDRMAGRMATDDIQGLAGEALARWNALQRPPTECNGVFAWLRAQGLITPDLAEARTRAALAADNPRLAHEFIAELSGPRTAPLQQWLQLLDTPKAALTSLAFDPTTAVEFDALIAGFTRLAFSDWQSADTLLVQLLKRTDLTAVQQNRLRRSAALGEANGRAPTAVASFAALAEDDADTQVLEWRVRAALWAGDFTAALRWIDSMPAAQSGQPRWRYWRARAVASTAGAAAAAAGFADIAGMRDYYGYLAADQLHQKYDLNIKPSPDDRAEQKALAADPGLMRAHALFDCDLADDASAEWAAVLGNAKPAKRIQAARLASGWGWYAQTIASLAQAGEWDDVALRYPRPYAAEVAAASKQQSVPTDWLFAVMRQESLFRKDAVSRADARGLMQMQPATALAVARRAQLPAPSRNALFEPATAIDLGAAYMRELLDRYNGQLELVLAAYNAGPLSVTRWSPQKPVEAQIWIENIPYTETRGYVQHILEHIVAFAVVGGAEPPRVSGLLPPLGP